LSREATWLRAKFSPQALEASIWYATWVKHRNRWLGYDEWKLPGCDLTVSERLGRKEFTALVTVPQKHAIQPGFNGEGYRIPLPRPYRRRGGFVLVDQDERCPECTGSCKLQSEGNDPCLWRERIKADHKGLERILQRIGRKRRLLDSFALDGQFPAPFEIVQLEEVLMQLHRFFMNSQSMADWSGMLADWQKDSRAKPLSIVERMTLFAKQSPYDPRAHEVVLHVAKTEGIDLKYLGRVASTSAAAAAGRLLIAEGPLRDKVRRALDIGLTPGSHSVLGEEYDETFLKTLIVAALEELKEGRRKTDVQQLGDLEQIAELMELVEPGRTKTETIDKVLALLDQQEIKKAS
jgi:hypothetical protein